MEDAMKIEIKGIEELKKKLSDTDWAKIAKDAMRDAMKTTELLPRPTRQVKKKDRKSRKYWKRLAKNFQQGLWVYEGWMENSDSELQKVKEQLEDEIRGRDIDKCKLDAMANVYRKYRRSTAEWRLSDCNNEIAEILGGVASADDPFLEKYDAPSCKDDTDDATSELLAIREEQLLDEISAHENECEPKLADIYDEWALTKERLAKSEAKLQKLEKYKKYLGKALEELRETEDELSKVKDALYLALAKEEPRISSKKLNMAEWWSNKAKDNHAKLQEIRETYEVTMEHGREDPHDAGCCYFAGMSQIGGVFKSVGEVLDDIGKR